MVNSPIPNQSETAIQPVRDVGLERSRMTDVMFLLETLFAKEETIVLQILDRLYDVGSVNLINQRVRRRPLNRIAKWVARHSKPVFKIVALRWFKRNCPKLITDWLYTQVKFDPKKLVEAVEVAEAEVDDVSKGARLAEVVETSAIQPAPVAELELYQREVHNLHSRIKLLTTLLLGVTVTLGTGLAWSLSRGQAQSSYLASPTSARLTNKTEPCGSLFQPCQ